MKATSTTCNAVFPDLGLSLPAGIPTEIPDSAAAQVLAVPGVVVEATEPAPAPDPPAPVAETPTPDTPAAAPKAPAAPEEK